MTKIRFNNQQAKQLFAALSKFTEANGVIPILSYFKFSIVDSKLLVTAGNLETFVTAEITLEIGEIISQEITTFCVDSPDFLDAIASTNDATHFEIVVEKNSDGEPVVTAKTSDYTQRIPSQTTEDYPIAPELSEQSNTRRIGAGDLRESLNTGLKFIDKDLTRPAMCGIFIEFSQDNDVIFTATDSKVLYNSTVKNIEDFDISNLDSEKLEYASFILDGKGATKLLSVLPAVGSRGVFSEAVSIKFDDTYSEFSWGRFVVVSRNIASKFPAYRNVLPDLKKSIWTVKTTKKLITDALRRIGTKANSTGYTEFHISVEGGLVGKASDLDMGREATKTIQNCTVWTSSEEGNSLAVAFDYKKLLGLLQDSMLDGGITLHLTNPAGAIVVSQAAQPGVVSLCMPRVLNSAS